jgi:hypothetical protein
MANFTRNFVLGKMNKTFDERVVPEGEYIDAMNVRMGSTEKSEVGVIENTKGNLPLTVLTYIDGTPLSTEARCIGAIDDSARETIYWFVHDPNFTASNTGKLDLVVSYNVSTLILTYHIVSVDDGGGVNTTLNFNPQYLITGVDMIENLIFWTDDYNQPRFININRNYDNPNGAGIDYNGQPAILAESILVIKKPPVTSPSITLLNTIGQENYLSDRFICFAYRYKYADGEYSATSQWSEPAFVPQSFNFSPDSYLNEGMVNEYNAVDIFYDSGGPLVVGIDLLFKQATNNIIKVIEKIDKVAAGLSDNTTYSYFFNNSKIFTILSESELLRLYDNVPRLAKAQTIMGNRLMYGNYVDGYDVPTRMDYYTQLEYKEINTLEIPTFLSDTTYNIDISHTVANSSIHLDLAGFNLVQGALIEFNVVITHDSFTGAAITHTEQTPDTTIPFSIYLQNDYTSVYDFAISTEFLNAIGTSLPGGNIQVVYNPIPGGNNSCDGNTLTDRFNCALPLTLDAFIKYESGIDVPGEAIKITTYPSSDIIELSFLAMRYVNNPASITQSFYEYYKIISYDAFYSSLGAPKSLHSNRGYEIGIVYMDEFNRATTTFCSPNNTVFVPCEYSRFANSIKVTIPTTQIAPPWAKRYKFTCKADMAGYETIYSQTYFSSTTNNDIYFLLEGENARKVEVGDRLIVKADSSGPTTQCVYVTVLEKEAKQSGAVGTNSPAGVYMKISSTEVYANTTSVTEYREIIQDSSQTNYFEGELLLNLPDPANPGNYIDFDIPAGSSMRFWIDCGVNQNGFHIGCNTRSAEFNNNLDKIIVSSFDYNNFYDWFVGENIESLFNNYRWSEYFGGASFNLIPGLAVYGPLPNPPIPGYDSNYDVILRFERDSVTQKLILRIRGLKECYTWFPNIDSASTVWSGYIFKSTIVNPFIFETMPLDTLPDVFYENNLSFPIDANGNHLSNGATGDQSQDIALGIPAIIQTDFFNCFSFGNGAESYKIRDSIIGRDFNLGNRVTTVAAQDYKESRRIADITYSGVYNPETNVNKLNEFNSGLLNYKNLELSFGAIQKMDGRETDVLVLQEDKISYVLAGKNLLSDAAAGGAITSVPEVLGTQIARTEKYGISFNPESYVQWGYDRFFTDAKRGAVLQLRGNSYNSDQLAAISDMNMRTWFRDEFNSSFNTQKLGGYDPYMNEYVLTINDIDLPFEVECIKCGTTQTLTFAQGEKNKTVYNYCIDTGVYIGDVVIDWFLTSIDPSSSFLIQATYDNIIYSSGPQNSAGQLTFFKYLTEGLVSIELTVEGNAVINITVACPVKEPLNLVQVVLTNNYEAGTGLVTQFYYTNPPYISPTGYNFFTFLSGPSNPLVSLYSVTSGFVGTGIMPPAGATMTLQTNINFPWASFVFDTATDRFKYHRSTTLYNNNSVDMNALLAVASTAMPISNPSSGIYNASFTVPPSINGDYLYLIWDLRSSTEVQLCQSDSLEDVCCNCIPCTETCSYYIFVNPETATENAIIEFPSGTCFEPVLFTQVLEPGNSIGFCLLNDDDNYIITQGNPIVYMDNCYCGL